MSNSNYNIMLKDYRKAQDRGCFSYGYIWIELIIKFNVI